MIKLCDFSTLSPQAQKQYVELLEDGSLDAIAKAKILLPSATADAHAIRSLRQYIAGNSLIDSRKRQTESVKLVEARSELEHEIKKLQQKIGKLNDQITSKNDLVVNERMWRSRIGMAMQNRAIAAACLQECKKVGF